MLVVFVSAATGIMKNAVFIMIMSRYWTISNIAICP